MLEILVIFGGIIVGLFSERTYFYTIFSKMYQIEKPAKPDSELESATEEGVMNDQNVSNLSLYRMKRRQEVSPSLL